MTKKTVVLGLSGGVDSSVAAYLLKEQGYHVIGVFMKNWDSALNNDVLGNPTLNNEVCDAEIDYQDVVKVAEQLGIECHSVDFVKEYWDKVFTYFLDEYKKYRTPNPDVLCNKEIKFKAFLDYALSIGADFVATGHYAQVKHEENKSTTLIRAVDHNKDQTYFLAQVPKENLEKILFPIGHLTKPEVREIAAKINLATASKKDSTGICFIGERDFKQFLQNYLPAQSGKIVDIQGNIVGSHHGLMYYTIGQRNGLNIGGAGGPWYVSGKNISKNELIVVNDENIDKLYANIAFIDNLNIYDLSLLNGSTNITVKFRYRQKDIQASIQIFGEEAKIICSDYVKAITPGQFAVFYSKEICLGSGVINSVYRDEEKFENI